ncbi:uncharacterized protein EV420DRAFT_1565106 [Desarmillaria tabescens]|uniref:Uncharacterized protein n=1 Tax=Armillaria tabescens TaxID=1929756 RepID=A0AA39MX99_ARMTA|nr:uncharacterized protein EV420DRAFT_1565106 [Desarmillaria tabescens]KAK0449628.1 hypothetical protein EV420DRAFT_1565106 [Desarmillaria tabescens]
MTTRSTKLHCQLPFVIARTLRTLPQFLIYEPRKSCRPLACRRTGSSWHSLCLILFFYHWSYVRLSRYRENRLYVAPIATSMCLGYLHLRFTDNSCRYLFRLCLQLDMMNCGKEMKDYLCIECN